MQGQPLLIAHRGLARDYPENTLLAFRAAQQAGADAVEMDIQFAACGTAVVIHDPNLERTTGQQALVQEMTAVELCRQSAHEPARLGEQYHGETIPTLAGAAAALAGDTALTVFIEIKPETLRRHALPAMLKRVDEDTACLGHRRVIISLVEEVVQVFRSATHDRVGWVLPGFNSAVLDRARTLAPEFVFCNRDYLPLGNGPLPAESWDWAIYEVASATQAMALMRRGVRWLETMAPGELRQALIPPRG